MTTIRVPQRFRWLRLIAAVGVVLASYQVTFSQTAPIDQEYIRWLEERSVLFQADQQDEAISGKGVQWREDYGRPEPAGLIDAASVWLLYYPGSVITSPGKSVIGTWADPRLWTANHDVGIELLRTNPIQRAGGVRGKEFTPTIDGWFDRIGLDIDPQLGTEEDMKQLSVNAKQQGATIGGDLVPLHTGLGPDFRLAERGYKDYDGIYNMVEIDEADWGLLPRIDDPFGIAHVSRDSAIELKKKGYIPGIIDSADADPEANNWSGWSATPEVTGADGGRRRSVFLHVFKPAQPAFNWLDPTYAARRIQFGDAARNVLDRGVRVLRLDANTFLGLEPRKDGGSAMHYLTPLANVSTTDVAFMIRKIGGWSYQEFAAPLAQLKQFAPNGADMSYDFFTRAEVLYALINGDVLPLRLGHHFLMQAGVPAGTLIHDLQNHDEITFQMFELGAHDDFQFEGRTLNGKTLKEKILDTMRTSVAGDAAPYNLLYRPEKDGVATTFAGFIAPALGVRDPYNATPDEVALIRRGHLLVAHANAMIPGVFALSAWDVVGALPVPVGSIAKELTAGGDWRWINRGGVDLVGANPSADKSAFGMPRAKALYGPLPEQLKSPDSFASQLKRMMAAREKYGIARSQIVAVPSVSDPAVCVLVMTLPDRKDLAITALNYGRQDSSVAIDLATVAGATGAQVAGRRARDIVAETDEGVVSGSGQLTLELGALSGKTVVLQTDGRQPGQPAQNGEGPQTQEQPKTPGQQQAQDPKQQQQTQQQQQEEVVTGAREGYLTPFATRLPLIERELRRISAFQFHGYFRAGAGVNTEGGNQVCFQSPGAPAKYRLGNECEAYSELLFNYDVYRPEIEGPIFRANARLAFDAGWLVRYQDAQLFAPEVYVEGSNLFAGGPLAHSTFWAGKRFYRQEQVALNDFYFWDLSGPGAGVDNIQLPVGRLSVAYLRSANGESRRFTVTGTDPDGNSTEVTVPGAPAVQNNQVVSKAQVHWSEIPVNPNATLNVALEGRDLQGPSDGVAGSYGLALHAMHTQRIWGGFNQAIFQYGQGLAADLSPVPDLIAEDDARTYRIIDWLLIQPSPRYTTGFVAIYQRATGVQSHAERWLSLGARPIYNFSNYLRLAVELGADFVKPRDGDSRQLTKVTVAPELATGRDFYDRPVLRLFVTFARWNTAAGQLGVVRSDSGFSPFGDDRHGVTLGVQTEAWW